MALWAPGSRCAGAFGVPSLAAAPCRDWDLGPGPRWGGAGRLRTCAGGLERGPLDPPPPSRHLPLPPSPGPFVYVLPGCHARLCFPRRAPRPERRVHTPFWQRVELGAGWAGPQPQSSGPRSSLPLPETSRSLGASFQPACCCGESCTLWQSSEGRKLEERVGKVQFFQVSWKLVLEVCSYRNERSDCYRRRKGKPKNLWLLLTRLKQDRMKGSTALELTIESSRYNC